MINSQTLQNGRLCHAMDIILMQICYRWAISDPRLDGAHPVRHVYRMTSRGRFSTFGPFLVRR